MARALQTPATDPLFQTHPKLTRTLNGYTYTVERRGDQVAYTVTDGAQTLTIPIHYAFGVGSQTFVLEREGKMYEGLVSFYPAVDGLDTTIGDQSIQPHNIVGAMGRELASSETTACFSCHATGAVANHQLKLDAMTPGVKCEHCHVGASEHFEAITHAQLNSIPPKLKKLSPEDLSNFCGQCHRTWETVMRNRWRGPINVRFQPYRLANSKCFDGVDPRMSCIACHDPHREIVRDEKSYDAKCLACHTAGAKPSAGLLAAHAADPSVPAAMKTCPVAQSDCASCHMPKVDLPGGHMVFHDHDIRVVHADEPYPN